jgi:hypothetical protein
VCEEEEVVAVAVVAEEEEEEEGDNEAFACVRARGLVCAYVPLRFSVASSAE